MPGRLMPCGEGSARLQRISGRGAEAEMRLEPLGTIVLGMRRKGADQCMGRGNSPFTSKGWR